MACWMSSARHKIHSALTPYQLQSLLPFCSAVQCKHHRGVILDTWKCSLSIVPTLLKYPLSNLPSQPTLGKERNTNLSNFITLNLTLFLSCTFLFRHSPLAPLIPSLALNCTGFYLLSAHVKSSIFFTRG